MKLIKISDNQFNVHVSEKEVIAFKRQWPCSNLPERAIIYQFDRGGDLINYFPYNFDSRNCLEAFQVLSQDAQAFAMKKLNSPILPTIKELSSHLTSLKGDIEDDYKEEEDESPGIDVTLGADETGFGIQTGDNSYTGSAYGYRHWGVSRLYRNSNCRQLAKDLIEQVKELAEQ